MRKARSHKSRDFVLERCRATFRLRERARVAEGFGWFWAAVAVRVNARAQEQLAEMQARLERAEESERIVRTAARREREALVRFVESPEWDRDLYVLLRQRLRAANINYRWGRQACSSCGGFGMAFFDDAFVDDIRRLEAEHGLEAANVAVGRGAVPNADPLHWPKRLGLGKTVCRGEVGAGRQDADAPGASAGAQTGPRVGFL